MFNSGCTPRPRSLTRLLPAAVILFLACAVSSAWAQHENAKFLAYDGKQGDWFGHATAVSGEIALVAAPMNRNEHGAVYAFHYDPGTGTWNDAETKLIAPDGVHGDRFGWSIALSGNVAVIGAPYNDNNNGDKAGAAYVFEYDGFDWDAVQKLKASDGTELDHFGEAVAISGDVMLIGMPDDGIHGNGTGAAYVFRFDAGSGSWIEEQKLVASDGEDGDDFGESVSIDGDIALIGAKKDGENYIQSGSVYMFRFDSGSGSWTEEQKIPSPNGNWSVWFGFSVSVSGEAALIGAQQDGDGPVHGGAAYVFRYDSGSGTWIEEQKLISSDIADNDHFGECVSLSGDVALVGAYEDDDYGDKSGGAYVFHYDSGSGTWTQGAKLLPSDGAENDRFGNGVAVSADFAVVGANLDDDVAKNAGSAYVFNPDLVPPLPDIKVNDLDGPLTITTGDDVTVKVVLDPGDLDGTGADWWIFVEKDAANTWWAKFRSGLKPQWTNSAVPIRFASANLRTVNGYTVIGPRTLPVGSYIWTFCTDLRNDMLEGTYIDTVEVTVN